mmetsp:Transcript_18064/g.37503  ORF Transcript_18064/g.37503 Transcript_18064/m.37503 type:complete len:341 (-) Transcript_18064:395-1417(-)
MLVLGLLLVAMSQLARSQSVEVGFYVKELFGCSMCYSETKIVNYQDVCRDMQSRAVDIGGVAIDPGDNLLPQKCRCQTSLAPLISVPLIGSAMVMAYSDPGCQQSPLRLSTQKISGIYSGTITNWKQIPGCSNVDLNITLCERCDNSMQMAAFTRSLKCMGVQIPHQPCCAPGTGFVNFFRPRHIGCSSVGGDLEGDCTRSGEPRLNRVHGDVQTCVATIRGSIAAFRYCDYIQMRSITKVFRFQTAGGRWVSPTRDEITRGVQNSNCGARCIPSDGWPMIVVPRMIYRTSGYGSQAPIIRDVCKDTILHRCTCNVTSCYFPLPITCRRASTTLCQQIQP